MAYPIKTPAPHMCYSAKYGRSTSKGIDITNGYPPNFGILELCLLGRGKFLTPYNLPLPTWVTMMWSLLVKWYHPTYGELLQKLYRYSLPFKIWNWNLSEISLKVTRTDMVRSGTYDFLVTFCSNHGPILYCFPDNARHSPKTVKFLPIRPLF